MKSKEKFFDRVASSSNPEPNQSASMIIKLSKEYLDDDNVILDFGCRAGSITNQLANTVSAIKAIDISSGMLDFARTQTQKKEIDNVECSGASIFDEEFNQETLDIITAFNVLHYIKDIPNLMKRIKS